MSDDGIIKVFSQPLQSIIICRHISGKKLRQDFLNLKHCLLRVFDGFVGDFEIMLWILCEDVMEMVVISVQSMDWLPEVKAAKEATGETRDD